MVKTSPPHLQVCTFPQVNGRLTAALSGDQGVGRPPQDTRTGSPTATPRADFGPRDGAMRKRRSGARSDCRRRLEMGWGKLTGVRHGKGPTTQ